MPESLLIGPPYIPSLLLHDLLLNGLAVLEQVGDGLVARPRRHYIIFLFLMVASRPNQMVVLNRRNGGRIDAQLAAFSLEILDIWLVMLLILGLWGTHGSIQLQRWTGLIIWTLVSIGTG